MSLTATPHLNFRGDARAALAFYAAAFDGQVNLVTYQESGQAAQATAPDDILWGQVTTASGLRVMAYDVQAERPWHPGENAVYIVVAGTTAGDITGPWDRLRAGATILQDLAPTPWSPLYGMLRDRFGITWVLSIASQG